MPLESSFDSSDRKGTERSFVRHDRPGYYSIYTVPVLHYLYYRIYTTVP